MQQQISHKNRDYQRITQAISFLRTNHTSQPSLEQVADQVGLSAFHFQRLFQRWAGVTPKQFLKFLTAENAKVLLRASRSVLETSHQVGLSGPSRLHDLFVTCEAVTPGEYKSWGRGLEIRHGFHSTPFGKCLLATTSRGVCHLEFVDGDRRKDAVGQLKQRWAAAEFIVDQRGTGTTLKRIFDRNRKGKATPLGVFLRGTEFQVKVWCALLEIPEGEVTTYGAIAQAIDMPTATRAAANAIGQNPIGYLVPCHRVIRGTGNLGGFRSGLPRKMAMLAREAAQRGSWP